MLPNYRAGSLPTLPAPQAPQVSGGTTATMMSSLPRHVAPPVIAMGSSRAFTGTWRLTIELSNIQLPVSVNPTVPTQAELVFEPPAIPNPGSRRVAGGGAGAARSPMLADLARLASLGECLSRLLPR